MARPVDDANQMLAGYALYKRGVVTGAALWRKLVESFGDDAKTERQVRRWIEHYKGLDKSILNLDEPFEWHRLDEYGLPWEASYELLEVWAFYQRLRALLATPLPTVRRAIWWWRIIKAMPGVGDMHDILSVAGAFVEREIRHQVLAETLDLTDLEACLAFSPWEGWPDDPTCANRYQKAIFDGVIPDLRIPTHEDSLNLYREQGFSIQQTVTSALGNRDLIWPNERAKPHWLLPSQLRKDEIEAVRSRGRNPFDVGPIRTRVSGIWK